MGNYFLNFFILIATGLSIHANANTASIFEMWEGHYELADASCKTGKFVLGGQVYYGKSMNIKIDAKYSDMRFEVLTENGLLGSSEDYRKVNTGKYQYTNTCWSDGLVSRSTLTASRTELKKHYEKLKPFAFCTAPFLVTHRDTAKIAGRDKDGNVFYWGCWFKKDPSTPNNVEE